MMSDAMKSFSVREWKMNTKEWIIQNRLETRERDERFIWKFKLSSHDTVSHVLLKISSTKTVSVEESIWISNLKLKDP